MRLAYSFLGAMGVKDSTPLYSAIYQRRCHVFFVRCFQPSCNTCPDFVLGAVLYFMHVVVVVCRFGSFLDGPIYMWLKCTGFPVLLR